MKRLSVCFMIALTFVLLFGPTSRETGRTDHLALLDSLDADRTWSSVNSLVADGFEGRLSGTQPAELAS